MQKNEEEVLIQKAEEIHYDLKEKGVQVQIDNLYPMITPPNHIRVVCISDTHCFNESFKNVPAGDILIHAGDFTQIGSK